MSAVLSGECKAIGDETEGAHASKKMGNATVTMMTAIIRPYASALKSSLPCTNTRSGVAVAGGKQLVSGLAEKTRFSATISRFSDFFGKFLHVHPLLAVVVPECLQPGRRLGPSGRWGDVPVALFAVNKSLTIRQQMADKVNDTSEVAPTLIAILVADGDGTCPIGRSLLKPRTQFGIFPVAVLLDTGDQLMHQFMIIEG